VIFARGNDENVRRKAQVGEARGRARGSTDTLGDSRAHLLVTACMSEAPTGAAAPPLPLAVVAIDPDSTRALCMPFGYTDFTDSVRSRWR